MRGLGGQLEAVLALKESSTQTPKSALAYVPITALTPNPYIDQQPSQHELDSLVHGIRQQGLIQPILARQEGALYQVLSGAKYWRAAQTAGLLEVPLILTQLNDQAAKAFSLLDSLSQGVNPVAEAEVYLQLASEFAMTHQEVGKLVGKSRTHISNYLRLLSLSLPVQEAIRQGRIELAQARYLVKLTPCEQQALARDIGSQRLTAREVAARVQPLTSPDDLQALQAKIGSHHKISINKTSRGYELTAKALTRQQLEKAVEALVKLERI